jgi:hypothetical protein
MKSVKKLLFLAGVVSLLGGTHVVAAEATAKEVVSKAFKYLGGLDQYAFDAVIYDKYTLGAGETEKFKHTVSVKLDRPEKLRVDVKGDVKDRSSYFNDGLFTMVDHDFGYYGQLKTPKNIDGALDFVINKYGIKAPLTSLLYSDMDKRAKFGSSKNFGVKDVAGVPCDYVAFKKKNKVIHIWIARGDKPLVKAYAIIEVTKEATYRIDTSVTWKDASSIQSSDFVFKAPKGVTKISVESAN